MDVMTDLRTATAANGIIVAFHVYIALAVEGLWFLIPVATVGGLVAAAYVMKGKVGAVLLGLPTLGYLLLLPELIGALSSENSPGAVEYVLVPFWLLTIVINGFTIYAEATGTSSSAAGVE